MEVVAAAPPNGGGVPPFHDHDVREWSRIDSLTGVLERARLETDHWTANTNNARHKYNKVVDSRARTQADGALQQKAQRQLEVYQSQIPGGHLQVIKTHTVSTSRWSNKTTTTTNGDLQSVTGDFENLQLSVNPIDLSSEKSKATVGRSCGRRPPSRPRLKDDSGQNCQRSAQQQAAVNLYRVSRLCHQIHDQTVKQTIGRYHNQTKQNIETKSTTPTKLEIGHKPLLTRTKSTSSEDIHLISPDKDKTTKSIEDLEDLEQLQSWRRTSKLRRSLQFPKTTTKSKPSDLPENSGTVKKIREELEKGRRLNTALRGNNVDLEALDQILQSISSSNSSDKASIDDSQDQDSRKQKRNSFVTVETLQQVRGRLRRTSSPTLYQQQANKDEEIDDGIVTEETNDMATNSPKSRVRSYVYGMETMLNKKPTINNGTGSLESRSKLTNGNTNLRTEDWYNRRKSYGFEQMHNQNESTNSLNNKNRVESSTDSGICRSTEIAIVPTSKPESPIKESSNNNVKQISSIFDRKHDMKATTITIPIKSNFHDFNSWNDQQEIKRHSIAVDESKYVQTTPDTNNRYRRTSLAVNDKEFDEAISQNRKLKKVEFCKTEVHFAAESGKVNIVETDEKPPPTNNFRRRRRNSGLLLNDLQHDLPVLHFGDSSYEKSLLGVAVIDDDDDDEDDDDDDDDDYPQTTTIPCGTVTVNTGSNQIELPQRDDDKVEKEIDNIKGILKNKPIKPIPYHLGENDAHLFDGDAGKWGVKLRPINNDPPFWKSTVTLHNTIYNNHQHHHQEQSNDGGGGDDQPEFRRLLKNLRPTSLKPDLLDHKNSDSLTNTKFVTPMTDRRSWSIADRIKLSNDSNQSIENKVYSTRINFDDNGATVIENDFEKNPRTRLKTEDSNQIINKGLVVRIGHDDYTSKHTVCSKTTTTTTQQETNNTTTTTKITIDLSPSPTTTAAAPIEFNQKSSPILSRSHSFKSTSLILDTIKNEKNKIPHQLEMLKRLYEDVQSDSDADKEVQILMGESGNDNDSVVSGSWSKMRAYKTITEHANNKTFKFDTNLEKDNSNNNFKYLRSISGKVLRDSPEKLSSPSLVGKNSPRTPDKATDLELFTETKFIKNDIVLRQPKKSEMTYFGVKVASPKPIKKVLETKKTVISGNDNKPDLLKHMKDKTTKDDTRNEPIYENLNQIKTREFDSKILEELTKAADEILQAVNGFADDKEDNSCTEEVTKLETISETKSWSKSPNSTKPAIKQTKSKLRTTPSNSSVESLSKDYKKTNSVRRCLQTTTTTNERLTTRKKTSSDSSNSKATTRARRLQRASSREALLQSHGSSSEDLGVNNETPIRKPRQIRKTKTTQLSISNGVEMKKPVVNPPNPPRRRRDEVKKNDEFIRSSEPLPEIRHKTAVSTIRSTAEKAKLRNEETKKRSTTTKRDTSRVLNSDSKRSSISKEIPTVNHRISTANIKKCQRADGSMRH